LSRLIRRVVEFLCVTLVACGLSACAPRPTADILTPVVQPPSYTNKVRLLVATTRDHDPNNEDSFTAERSKTLNYAALTVSIPKKHKVGQIEWPDQPTPDPSLHFLTTERQTIARGDFLKEIQANSSSGASEAHSVLVFIHGYNTLYEEAVYRFAQIVHDSGFTGTAVLFAWPSRGKAPLYLADRDASTYSRDYLERALQDMAGVRGVQEINILAHSMGNWLAVETLRQAKMKGHGDFGGKLGDVILASPDIDVNIFRTQLDTIGPLRRPITVLVSSDDKALAFSTLLSGGSERAGVLTAGSDFITKDAKRYNLRVVDLTKVEDGYGAHHSKFAESGAVLGAIGRGLATHDADLKAQAGVFTAVTQVGNSLLSIPATLIGAAVP
jgi:esterase/lipase superfamily enzyme